jgi:hypothetical protein
LLGHQHLFRWVRTTLLNYGSPNLSMTYVVRWGILYVAILTSSSSNLINFNRIFITHWKWSPNWFDKLKTILYKNKISSHKQICTIPNVNLVVVYIHCKSKRNHFLDSYHILLKNTVFFFLVHNAIKTWTLKNCREYKTWLFPYLNYYFDFQR